MRRRYNLTYFILYSVAVLDLMSLMVCVDAQARIAFMSDRDWNWEIYVMDNDGGNPRNLTNDPVDNWNPSWSPDGKHIVFTSSGMDIRIETRQIYVIDADGKNMRKLSNNHFSELHPAWSPDGKRIAFTSGGDINITVGNCQIYVIDADGGNQRNLSNNRFNDENPSWSPDGKQIAFDTLRGGNMEIYVMTPMGTISETSPIMPVLTKIRHGPLTVNALPLFPLEVGTEETST